MPVSFFVSAQNVPVTNVIVSVLSSCVPRVSALRPFLSLSVGVFLPIVFLSVLLPFPVFAAESMGFPQFYQRYFSWVCFTVTSTVFWLCFLSLFCLGFFLAPPTSIIPVFEIYVLVVPLPRGAKRARPFVLFCCNVRRPTCFRVHCPRFSLLFCFCLPFLF